MPKLTFFRISFEWMRREKRFLSSIKTISVLAVFKITRKNSDNLDSSF